MTNKFGEIAVNMGFVTRAQLKEALQLQLRGRDGIGVILVRTGIMTPKDVAQVVAKQKTQKVHTKMWGEVAIEMGFISKDQLEKTLEYQKTSSEVIGQILVDLGYMNGLQRVVVKRMMMTAKRREEIIFELKKYSEKWFVDKKIKDMLEELEHLI